MAYTPTLADIEEIEGQQAKGGYTPSLADIDEIEKSQDLHIGNTGLNKDFKWSQMPTALSKEIPSLAKTGLGNLEYGTLNLGRHIGNVQLQLLEALGLHPSKIGLPEQIPESYLGKQYFVPKDTENTPLAQSMQLLGGTAPLALEAPEAGVGELLSATASQAPKAAGFLSKYIGKPLGQYAKNLAVGTAAAPFYSDKPIEEAGEDAISNPLMLGLAAIGPTFQSGYDVYQGVKRAINRAGGTATPEEVQERLAALKDLGVQTIPPAKVIDSPSLGRFESLSSVSPGSPMAQTQIAMGKTFGNKLNEALSSLGVEGEGLQGTTNLREEIAQEVGRNYSDPIQQQLMQSLQSLSGKSGNPLESRGQNLQEAQDELSNIWNQRVKIKNDKYDTMGQTAKDEGAMVSQDTITNEAKKLRDEMDIIQERHTLGGFDADLYHDLGKIIDQKKTKDFFTGQKDQYPQQDFKDVNVLKKYYWDKSEQAYASGNRKAGKAYRALYNAYDQDIKQAAIDHVNKNPSSKLLDQYMDANDYVRTQLAPIQDNKALFEHALRKRPSEQLAKDFFKTGSYENSSLSKQLMDILSPQSQDKIALSVATRGMNEIDPKQLFKNLSKNGLETKKILSRNNPDAFQNIENIKNNFDQKLFDYGIGERDSKGITKEYVPLSKETENPTLTHRLMSILSPEGQAKVLLDRISKGQTEANKKTQLSPQAVINKFDNLPPRTKAYFQNQFPDAISTLKNLSTATGMFKPGEINPMLIPKTGFTGAAQDPLKEMEKGIRESLFSKKNVMQGIGHLLTPIGLRALLTKALLNTNVPQRYLQSFTPVTSKNMNQIPIAQLLAAQQGQQNK
jgi:hypothetical protein